jgi:flap endonuclease-1
MGIRNFRKFIISNIDEPIKKVYFDEIKGKIKSIAVDINIFIYKFITAIRRTGKDLYKNGKIMSHLIGLKHQINLFKKLNIKPIYVFDGQAPIEKNKTLTERLLIKEKAEKIYKDTKSIQSYQQSFLITDDIIDSTIEFLEENKIIYIYDEEKEADYICAYLMKTGKVDCVYSTDFDILAYGANCLILNIDYRKKYFEYISLKYILKELDISLSEFLDIIVVSGCDYCEKTQDMTLNRAYKKIIDGETIKLNKEQKKARELFLQ